jgi:hypothetical protein
MRVCEYNRQERNGLKGAGWDMACMRVVNWMVNLL